MQENRVPKIVQELAEGVVGKIVDCGRLPDDSGFAVMTMPLPASHWLHGDPACERFVCEYEGKTITHEAPPMPYPMGTTADVRHFSMTRQEFAENIRRAGKYAIRVSTDKGKLMDFDPDAMLQNLIVGMLGYWTETGLSDDEWANPETT